MNWNVFKWWQKEELDEETYAAAKEDLQARVPVPVLWLFGKTGSGKSTIVRYLTGAEEIAIGRGFRPETKFSSRYDFPDAEEPLLSFLDTRGIGEASYDPRADIAAHRSEANLMIVTVRAMDHALEELLTSLRTIRQQARQLPVLLVLTALHDAYPGEQHPEPDPFGKFDPAALPNELHPGLRASLQQHIETLTPLVDAIVPIDITPDFEGFEQPDFGGERLKHKLLEMLPAAYRFSFMQIDEVVRPVDDLLQKKTRSTIVRYSTLAATAAAVPVPWIDIPVVMGLQTHMIYKLAKLYKQEIDTATIAQVTGAIGGRIAIRMGLRELLKFIPWAGMAANAAAAFAFTFAQGMAWNWYFTRVKQGHIPSEAELKEVFQNQLKTAAELWKTSH